MRLAAFSLALYTLLAIGGAAYGFNVDRLAGVIGFLPGFIGMVGLCVWLPSPEGMQAEYEYTYARREARIRSRIHAYRATRAGR